MKLQTFEDILAVLPQIQAIVKEMSGMLLANLVMLGEMPSPTFGEQRRVDFLKERFNEAGLLNCSIDEMQNIYGILPGETGKQNILMVAHLDTVFEEEEDYSVTVLPDQITGPSVADNSLGVAAITTLPAILQGLDIRLKSNLILMGDTRSLGRGDLQGLRFFLSNPGIPITIGLAVEGCQLGRLSYASIGMLRGEITCKVPDEYDWTRFGVTGAILNLNEIITQMVEMPLPRRPQTVVVLGSIEGGTSYGVIAKEALLRFEIRSESAEMVNQIRDKIEEITTEVASRTNTQVVLDFFARRAQGGITIAHPLCQQAQKIMQALNIAPQIIPSTSELSVFIDQKIPAITLGITTGHQLRELKETIQIEPIYTGLAQLVGVLLAIDGGFAV